MFFPLDARVVISEYSALTNAIENAGFFTTFQPIEETCGRIVCASHGGDWGMGGFSFWIAVRNGRWFIATWAPRFYEIPSAEDVVSVAIEALRNNDRKGYDINKEIKEQFSLIEVYDDDDW